MIGAASPLRSRAARPLATHHRLHAQPRARRGHGGHARQSHDQCAGQCEGRGRNARVVINLPQRPPILAGVQERDVVTVVVNNQTHTYQAGSALRLKEVAYGCWGS